MKLVSLGLLGVLVVAAGQAGDSRITEPSWPPARAKFSDIQGCVEPTEVMRKDHMRFLFHQRDRTVHQGIRTERHSLVGCVDCHSGEDQNGKPIPINAAGQFCQSCHAYAGVNMDCFQCHATTPPLQTSASYFPTKIAKPMTVMTLAALPANAWYLSCDG